MTRLSGAVFMLVSLASIMTILKCDQQNPKTATEQRSNRPTPAPTSLAQREGDPGTMGSDIKQLAAGNHCTVVESFVFVARDAQTYQALKTLKINVPDQDAGFFSSHAVIAAFLGQRRTGGF